MNKKLELTKQHVADIEKGHEYFEFPTYLQAIRKAHSLTRRAVCQDLMFSEMRMFWLEHGCFRREVPENEISMLAEYYGINGSLLKKKHDAYMSISKPQPSYRKKKGTV